MCCHSQALAREEKHGRIALLEPSSFEEYALLSGDRFKHLSEQARHREYDDYVTYFTEQQSDNLAKKPLVAREQ